MMSEEVILTVDLLQRLERDWRRHGAPLLEHLRDGLSDVQMDELTAPLELYLPAELRMWWGWHDGVSLGDIAWSVEREIGPIGDFLPLVEAVDTCLHQRAIARRFGAPDGAEQLWEPAWLPLTPPDRLGCVVCDCSDPQAALTPTRVIIAGDQRPDQPPGVASLGTAVTWWVEALERGMWKYDSEDGIWVSDADTWPTDRYATRLV